ncbi:transglutaminaseTgpA domain-containing protein [Nocardioides coralli]|uniref:transglutaminase family protein n=1 Tax=Nocardioides coralli TaxID=2872154 RepID=UPI001CA38CAB|nr:DUF3488 and transglutaminase-like domain-containing protein [Nocardioides coralli]QZY27970.1 DUF3488 and transglutaminase-like domain-containing protein [Nocardioides coralli]
MSVRHGSVVVRSVLGLIGAATTWCATLAWGGFSEAAGDYLRPLLVLAFVVTGTGALLHLARLPEPVVVLGQVVGTGLLAGSLVAGTPVFTSAGWSALGQRLAAAVESSQTYEAPVPADAASIAPILVLGGWLCLVLVDVAVNGLRRVPLAGLPLLTIYAIPVSLLGDGVPWWTFALTAAGFLLLLFVQQRELVARWGRGLGVGGGRDLTGASPTVRAAAGSLGFASLVLAVLIPQFVPTLSLSVFGFGPGSGSGDDITVENPMTDLRRDLNRGNDIPLVRFATDNPDPGYLRIAVLNNFTDNEWSTGDRDIPGDQQARGPLPVADIAPGVEERTFDHQVAVLEGLESMWLPTAFPVEEVYIGGDWRYDTATLDILSADRSVTTAGQEYRMVEVERELDRALLDRAPNWAGEVSPDLVELPDGFPAYVRNLALEVTRDYPSRYEKAVALQRWFREDGGFSYSLENVPPGNGTDEMVAFLTEGNNGRVGYCEQFASSMAAMARSLGIPARVAVGFLTPDRTGPDTWEYSAWDMHAWPELYFSGAGWVRFEPTPADRVPGVPSYTETQLTEPGAPEETEQPGPTADPSQTLQPDPRLDEGRLPEGEAGAAGEQPSALVRALPVLGGLAVGLLLLWLPRTLRRTQHRRRLRGDVEQVWAELRATAVDLGVDWPEQRSPRETRDHLVRFLGDPAAETPQRPRRGEHIAPGAVAGLDRLVGRLERRRYARPEQRRVIDAELGQDAEAVLTSLWAGANQKARRRATWWPVSLLPWRRPPETVVAPTLVRHGGVVDHVG